MLGAANRNAIEQMRRQELLTATPAQLTVKLFQRAILDLNRALAAMNSPATAASASQHLVHAQAIISELDATLDPAAWSGAEDLKSVYAYLLNTISAANQNGDRVLVNTALELLTPVAEAFAEAARTAPGAGTLVQGIA